MDAPTHYCLTTETKLIKGSKQLFRIQAQVDLPQHEVKAGDLGGWVERTDNLGDAAWLFNDAMVYNEARVYGYAQLCDRAVASDRAQVHGYAKLYDDVQVYGNAQVFDHATLSGRVSVWGTAHVWGHACLSDACLVYGHAQVFGQASAYGGSEIHGRAQLGGDCLVKHAAIFGDAVLEHAKDYLVLGPLGSDRFITLTKQDQCVAAGCFRGSVTEFAERVARDYSDGSDYARALPFIQSWLNPEPAPPKNGNTSFWRQFFG